MKSIRSCLNYCACILLLLSCEKRQWEFVLDEPVSFATSSREVKSTYIPATSLENLPIYVSGDYKKDNVVASFILNRTFTRGAGDMYHSSPVVTWPLDGKIDFLVYAGTDAALTGSGNPSIVWSAHPSDGAAFTFTNTKTADVDLVWATANGKSRQSAPVDLVFSHALARLELQVKATNLSGGKLRLKSVTLENAPGERLALGGLFTVDNTKNIPTGTWSDLAVLSDYSFFTGQNITFSSTGLTSLVGLLDGTARVARDGAVVPLVNMYVPEQGNKNLIVTYSLNGAADTVETINLDRGIWEPGKRYTYRLEFSSTGLEIIFNEPFDEEDDW